MRNLWIDFYCPTRISCFTIKILAFIRGEGVNTPPLGAVKKVLSPESNSLREQHTSRLAAGLLIGIAFQKLWICF
ncbi:hypothetical protein TREAZ_1107 [Leadbettera azotonutricia ZAS-9]|uniref:Uncharacterized protein n=1 Tax=Leadbettera azotonutricia (strain ATCC BAA-888 / DSM 13862 / ZAS-9) TaxID=545695 RepID=F5Y787_LEAAZ|nr:hypothetical protein TREAZ_1107 [Leadbettera azotonutricia ZAS-9]